MNKKMETLREKRRRSEAIDFTLDVIEVGIGLLVSLIGKFSDNTALILIGLILMITITFNLIRKI